MKTILLLGGYGMCGQRIARWLLQETDACLVVAGRHKEKADQLAARLNSLVPGQRTTATAADTASVDSLRAAFCNANLVLDCTSTTQHTEKIARVALAGGLDYLDLHFPVQAFRTLQTLAADIERAGCCFIIQAGFHPGLLAPLVRFAAPWFSTYQKANIGMVMNFCSVPYTESRAASAKEFMEEVAAHQAHLFLGGKWQRAG